MSRCWELVSVRCKRGEHKPAALHGRLLHHQQYHKVWSILSINYTWLSSGKPRNPKPLPLQARQQIYRFKRIKEQVLFYFLEKKQFWTYTISFWYSFWKLRMPPSKMFSLLLQACLLAPSSQQLPTRKTNQKICRDFREGVRKAAGEH